jgi:hypothetical protein
MMEEGRPATGAGPMVWVLRGVLALAALAAPIITFRAFTDTDTPDPVRQQRLRETQNEPPPQPKPARGTVDPHAGAGP